MQGRYNEAGASRAEMPLRGTVWALRGDGTPLPVNPQ